MYHYTSARYSTSTSKPNCNRHKHPLQRYKSFSPQDQSEVYSSFIGAAYGYPNTLVLENHRTIIRQDHKSMVGKVKLLGGGGAGLGLAEGGLVGPGMLTGVVGGEIFVSPSSYEILVAIRELADEHSDGILLLVKNYFPDRLNFGLALERAQSEDILVKMLLIEDGITFQNSEKFGRMGAPGTVLVYKIAGAMAERGKSLDDIIEALRESMTDIITVAVSITPSGKITWVDVEANDAVDVAIFGIGMYGQGGKYVKYTNLKETVKLMIDYIVNPRNDGACGIALDDAPIAVLVNNLGSATAIELCYASTVVVNELNLRKARISRMYRGNFIPLLDTKGFSVTVLKILSPTILEYLDAPANVCNWPGNRTLIDISNEVDFSDKTLPIMPLSCDHEKLDNDRYENVLLGPALNEREKVILEHVVKFAVEALLSCEKQLDIIDSEIGDGDHGTMLAKGARGIMKKFAEGGFTLTYPFKFFQELSDLVDQCIEGATGAIYYVLLRGASQAFQTAPKNSLQVWADALKAGVKAVQVYGRAEINDRTILDALLPTAESFETILKRNGDDLHFVVSSLASTCEYYANETRHMKPTFIRGGIRSTEFQYPDAGAHAASIWMRAICEGVKLNFPIDDE